jgi:hypothetical protein
MPHELSWEPHGAYNRYWGHVTGEEIEAAGAAIRQDCRALELQYVVSDFLAVESFEVTPYQALVTAAHDHAASLHNPGLRLAILTTDPQFAAVVQLYAESPLMTLQVNVFETVADMRSWLERGCPESLPRRE